jgi:regulatory protein
MAGRQRRRERQPASTDVEATGPPEDPENVARQILLRRLTEQPRSRSELATALARKHVPDDVADRLLNRFEEVGLVDDAAFAQAWVDSRHRGRGLGRRALSHELRRKGIDDAVVRDAVASVDEAAERNTARRLVERRADTLANLEPVHAQRRLLGMLARKGYSAGIAAEVVRDVLRRRNAECAEVDGTSLDLP